MDDPSAMEGQQLNEDGLPVNPEPVMEPSVISEEILKDMQNVFHVFDLEKQDKVAIGNLRVILRALDVDLNPEELELTKEKIDPDRTGFIRFANLKLIMEEKLKDTDTAADLEKLFDKLDLDHDKSIPVPQFKQFMLNMGSKMTEEEINAMVKEAGGDSTGVIDIVSFCERLCPEKPEPKAKK